MKWQDLSEPYKHKASKLIGTIDAGEQWIFAHGSDDPDFHGFISNKMLLKDHEFGVISASGYRDYQHISVAFNSDLPAEAETITVEILRDLVEAFQQNTTIWCRNENHRLKRIIENTFHVEPDYAAHEMSVSKPEFQTWKAPTLPPSYKLSGFYKDHHDEYINLLEEAMCHVSRPGTTPYLDRSDSMKTHFPELQRENRFHALWYEDTLVGICYSESGEISTLAVRENHRGKGLGYCLLYKALENAFIYRDTDICLYVVDHNPGAFQFYKRCNMRVTGHSTRYIIVKNTGL